MEEQTANVSRRAFLNAGAGAAATAAALATPGLADAAKHRKHKAKKHKHKAARCATGAPTPAAAPPGGRIDLHAHHIPPVYRVALLEHGQVTIGGYPTRYEGRTDDAAARGLRDTVKAAVQQGIDRLRDERDRDPKRGLLPRLASRDQDELPQTATEDPSAWMVTRAFEAWNEDGAGGAAAWISRRATLIDPPGWPGGDTWRGRDAVLRRLDEVAEQLRAETVEIRQARSLDGERVLADFVVCRAAGSGGHAGVSAILALHGDQITAMRVFTDHDQARRVAEPDARVAA